MAGKTGKHKDSRTKVAGLLLAAGFCVAAGLVTAWSYHGVVRIADAASGGTNTGSGSMDAASGDANAGSGSTDAASGGTGAVNESAGAPSGSANAAGANKDAGNGSTNNAVGGDTNVDPGIDVNPGMRIALTFDDGPHPVYTEELLDGLKERGIHATFFVIGKNIEGNEELIQRMAEEGHLIGNHTYDHVKISALSGTDACSQVERTSALVREITGKDTEFIRPPFGTWNNNLECSFEMIPVLWDVDPLDWTTKNTNLIVERVLDDTEPGDIILLHDYYESSVEAALKIIDELTEQGYEFVTVDELILE